MHLLGAVPPACDKALMAVLGAKSTIHPPSVAASLKRKASAASLLFQYTYLKLRELQYLRQ
jgi:hypothetical protein